MRDAHVLLGVEAIAPAGAPGRQWGELSTMLTEVLDRGGITPEDVVHHEEVGDGVRYAFPADRLGTVLDLTERLDEFAARRNRWHQPALRVKIAVDLGERTSALDRLLATSILDRCVEANSGLIMSDRAFRAAFGDDCATSLREADFAQVGQFWVRVPGVDPGTFDEPPPEAEAGRPMHVTNSITGNAQNVIQTGFIAGGVHFGDRR